MLLTLALALLAGASPAATPAPIPAETVARWSAPYRGWTYYPDYVVAPNPGIPGFAAVNAVDCPTVYQRPGDPAWYMTFIGFDGTGYQSFVTKSTDLVHWTQPELAFGYGLRGEFDYGGRVLGAFLYDSYDVKAPRTLKRRNGLYWTLYGAYPKQGGYELRPGYEGVAVSDDGLHWRRAQDDPILSIHQSDCAVWEHSCIYQPWLVESAGKFYDFYNAANEGTEQSGVAISDDLFAWKRYENNPVLRNTPDGHDEGFCSDPKVYRDGDHWIMFYFGVGKGGAHIMLAFSRDLLHWTKDPKPIYLAGGNPSGLDKQYAHKTSLVFNPTNKTFYLYYCAVGDKGRGVGLLTSRPLKR